MELRRQNILCSSIEQGEKNSHPDIGSSAVASGRDGTVLVDLSHHTNLAAHKSMLLKSPRVLAALYGEVMGGGDDRYCLLKCAAVFNESNIRLKASSS